MIEKKVNLPKELKRINTDIDNGIKKIVCNNRDNPDEINKIICDILLKSGGKRLRPSILILSAEAIGEKIENVLPAAIAVEMIHNFTLVHDDIMDDADIRRGLLTIYKKYGLSRAILVGDILLFKAFQILNRTPTSAEKKVRCSNILFKMCDQLCVGQWRDINFETQNNISESEYFKMIEEKTSILYAACAKLGGILGNGTEEQNQALWDFGRLMGIGFQIYDDVLDLERGEISGKIQGGDLLEGKQTLIIIHARKIGIDLSDVLGKKNATKKDILVAINKLKNSGSIEYAEEKAKNYIEGGKSKLDILPDTETKEILLALANYMIERKY